MNLQEAIDRFARWPPVDGREDVTFADALSRVLDEDVVAALPMPPYDGSAMDGYAFRFAEMPPDRRMPVAGRVAAGRPLRGALSHGSAVRIFTGGAMPSGADTVALQEHCDAADGFVVLPDDLREGANRRVAGEHAAHGSLLLTAGTRLRPQDIALAAASGRATVSVRRRVRVALLATGDELRTPAKPLPPGCIYDTNRHSIGAALRGLGAQVTDLGLIPDQLEAIRDVLAAATPDHDLIVTSGGVSVGEEDHVRPAVLQIGSLDFWKLAMKPGKPVAVGEIGGTPFVGLPGNPGAAMVVCWLLVRPLLLRLMGATSHAPLRLPVTAGFRHRHPVGRTEYLGARVRPGDQGRLLAEIDGSTGWGSLRSLVWSDGLVEVGERTGDVEVGDALHFLPYDTFMS